MIICRDRPTDGPKQKSALDVPIFVIYRYLSGPSRTPVLQKIILRQPLLELLFLLFAENKASEQDDVHDDKESNEDDKGQVRLYRR